MHRFRHAARQRVLAALAACALAAGTAGTAGAAGVDAVDNCATLLGSLSRELR